MTPDSAMKVCKIVLRNLPQDEFEKLISEVEITRRGRLLHGHKAKTRVLEMTFKDFVNERLHNDSRIRGIPLFHGHCGIGPNDYGTWGWPDEFVGYKTYGDVPIKVFVRLSEHQLLRIKSVSTKALRVLNEVLVEYGLSLKK